VSRFHAAPLGGGHGFEFPAAKRGGKSGKPFDPASTPDKTGWKNPRSEMGGGKKKTQRCRNHLAKKKKGGPKGTSVRRIDHAQSFEKKKRRARRMKKSLRGYCSRGRRERGLWGGRKRGRRNKKKKTEKTKEVD